LGAKGFRSGCGLWGFGQLGARELPRDSLTKRAAQRNWGLKGTESHLGLKEGSGKEGEWEKKGVPARSPNGNKGTRRKGSKVPKKNVNIKRLGGQQKQEPLRPIQRAYELVAQKKGTQMFEYSRILSPLGRRDQQKKRTTPDSPLGHWEKEGKIRRKKNNKIKDREKND